jgi:undecaprenyl diphosphate synthase
MKNYKNIPNHVAIVMDGNGRWAEQRGLKRTEGHKKGADALRKIVIFASKLGIKYLSLYAFSTENWRRPISEIKFLMNFSKNTIHNMRDNFNKENIKIIWSGTQKKLFKSVYNELIDASNITKNNTGMVLNICLNYGSRTEIVDSVNKILKLNKKRINEKTFSKFLYQNELPDVDLFIRTSGEQRISNFLLWQIAYSELYFSKTMWPDFNSKELKSIIQNEFKKRNRRFGA